MSPEDKAVSTLVALFFIGWAAVAVVGGGIVLGLIWLTGKVIG